MSLTYYKDTQSGDYVTMGLHDFEDDPYYAEGGPSARRPSDPTADSGNTSGWGENNQRREIADKLIDLDSRISAIDAADFTTILSWVPVVKNDAGVDITHLIESARYVVAGKICFYWFFLRYNLTGNSTFLKISLPVSAEPGTAGYEAGSGFAADSVYQSVYSLLNVSLTEVQAQRYDGADFTATGVRVLGMSGSYEID